MKKTISLQLELIRDKKERVLKSRREIAEKAERLKGQLDSLDRTLRKLGDEETKLVLAARKGESKEEGTSGSFSEASAKLSSDSLESLDFLKIEK